MAASSLSVAAISTCSSSSSTSAPSSSIDTLSFTSVHFPFKFAKPLNFSKQKFNFYPSSPAPSLLYHSLIYCSSEANQGIEESLEEEEEEAETEELEKEEEEEGSDGAVVSQSIEARRLYVGNLPFSMTSTQLAEVFAEAGRVTSVEIIYDRVTDRSRGFAFVTMGSVEEAKEAIRLFDGSQVGGRTVKVNYPEVPKGGEREVMGQKIRNSYQGFVDSPHKIYAGNLSWNLNSQGLREVFQDQPGYLSAKVIYERDTGRSRGFGFITFASAEEVESALNAMNGVELEGRPLRLNLAEQKPGLSTQGSFPQNETTSSDMESESSEVFSGVST